MRKAGLKFNITSPFCIHFVTLLTMNRCLLILLAKCALGLSCNNGYVQHSLDTCKMVRNDQLTFCQAAAFCVNVESKRLNRKVSLITDFANPIQNVVSASSTSSRIWVGIGATHTQKDATLEMTLMHPGPPNITWPEKVASYTEGIASEGQRCLLETSSNGYHARYEIADCNTRNTFACGYSRIKSNVHTKTGLIQGLFTQEAELSGKKVGFGQYTECIDSRKVPAFIICSAR